jgi:hypothetical protein
VAAQLQKLTELQPKIEGLNAMLLNLRDSR